MLRPIALPVAMAIALPLAFGGATGALAAPDPTTKLPQGTTIMSTTKANIAPVSQVADAKRPKVATVVGEDAVLYDIFSDQISEMRRKSALPTTMCIAESNGDGTYPAGRFVSLLPLPDGQFRLDLNRARNPFCAYSSAYPCPAPWRGNAIPAPIAAGERYEGGGLAAPSEVSPR